MTPIKRWAKKKAREIQRRQALELQAKEKLHSKKLEK